MIDPDTHQEGNDGQTDQGDGGNGEPDGAQDGGGNNVITDPNDVDTGADTDTATDTQDDQDTDDDSKAVVQTVKKVERGGRRRRSPSPKTGKVLSKRY